MAVAASAVTVALTATTTTDKAYGLTQNPGGSYTLILQDVQTALPAVNAEFVHLGIPAKAIRVTKDCTAAPGGLSLLSPSGESMSRSVTFSAQGVPAGWTDFIAVAQTPAGVRETIGNSSQTLPACFNSDDALPVTTTVVTRAASGSSTAPVR